MLTDSPSKWFHPAGLLLAAAFAVLLMYGMGTIATGADEDDSPSATTPADTTGDDGDEEEPAGDEKKDKGTVFDKEEGEFSLLKMIITGGGLLMIPIYLMSFLVVTIAIERFVALRRRRVMPLELVDGLGQLAQTPGGFDPRKAYRLCQKFPSSASSVIRAMLLKVGRPHGEVEHAVAEASEREAGRLYGNVRWLTLAAAVTPLMGLFGTVWGMILAFQRFSNLQEGQDAAEQLATGIYTALVTTLGGLAVAIPAAILAHYFEGRIQNLFHQIDELLFNLLPQVERYEGRLRVSQQTLGSSGQPGREQPADAAPAGASK